MPVTSPTVAVVIPNRNDARYLPRCLGSVLGQGSPPDEIIVVDDQSADDSVAVIRSLLAGVAGAQVVESPVNMGTMTALNEGLRRATSDYVLFLASNDYAVSQLFARAKAGITRTGSPGVWSAMVWVVDETDHLLRLHPSAVVSLHETFLPPEHCIRLANRLGNWFTGTTLFYHRETLRAVGGFDIAYKGLSDLLSALTVASLRGAAYTPEPLGVMREHAGGYLENTLRATDGLEAMLERLRVRGPQLSGALFTPQFLQRTAHRFRFAALRASGGTMTAEIAPRYAGFRRAALESVGRWVPVRLARLRDALAYLILRPFDLLPALWYRLGGALLVRVRLRLRSTRSP